MSTSENETVCGEASSWRHTAAPAVSYAGIAAVGIVVAYLVTPYPDDGCAAVGDTAACTLPSARQRRWLAFFPSLFALGVLAADLVRARLRGQGVTTTYVLMALAGAFAVLVCYHLTLTL